MMDYRYYTLSGKERRDFFTLGYLLCFLVIYLFYQSPIVSFVAGFIIVPGEKFFAEYKAEKRRNLLEEQFRDVLYALSASFAAGRQMPEGLKEALGHVSLIYEASSPMVGELEHLVQRLYESRESEASLLTDFGERSGAASIQSFVEVYLTCRSTGADVEHVVWKASTILMDKLSIEKEIRTLTSQKQLEGNLIGAMPLILLFLLNLASPADVAVLYSSIFGRLLMTGALLAMGYAYYLIIKLTKRRL